MTTETSSVGEYRALLNSPARRIFLGVLLNALGSGLTMSFLLVYLHDIRGFSNTFGALLLSFQAAMAILFVGPAGTLIDRFGPKPILMTGLLLETVGTFMWSLTTTQAMALFVATTVSLATTMTWPPQSVMLTRIVAEPLRQKAFAINFMLLNLGLGLGGMVAASILVPGNAGSFEMLYRIDALTFLVYFALIAGMKFDFSLSPEHHVKESGGYREVFRDRKFVMLTLASLGTLTFGYASLSTGLPIIVTQHLGLSPKWLGVIFGANTMAIVLLQVPVLKLISNRRKFWVIASVGVVFSISWAMVGVAALLIGAAAGLLVAASQVVFAFGEMLWSPTAPSLINELAPPHLQGRYNAIGSLQWSMSGVIGPALAALFFSHSLLGEWLIFTTVGSLLPVIMFVALARSVDRTSATNERAIA